ncbi:MAG: tetratricopeptide repeat protein [Pirellulales bacterium]
MARKLSEITRRALYLAAIAGGTFATLAALAEESIREPAPPEIVQNPFAAGASQSTTTAIEPQPPRRGETTYRNPFAANSTAPPIETPLLPGPVSRWRRSVVPLDEPSTVKTAILSADPIEPFQTPWDQLPPAATLRDRAFSGSQGTDAPAAAEFADPPDPVQFAAIPLAQPAWLTVEPRPNRADSPIGQASFDRTTAADRSTTWASGPTHPPRPQADFSPLVITDFDDSSEAWLAQAQQAASSAASLDDLSAVSGLCQRGLAASPPAELSSSLRRLAAWAHNRRGELLADAGHQQQAIEEFQMAISLDSNCSLAIHNRAVTLAEQNQLAAALRDFNRVIELNPGLGIAYRNRAELLAALGRLNEALPDYSRAIDSLPSDAELYAARGYAWQQLRDFERASADFDRAIEIEPDRPDTLAQRGNLAAERGDYSRALADFQQAIAIDPQCAEAYRSLAWLHATCSDEGHRNAEAALAAAKKALELSPADDYLVLDALAAAHAAAGQYDIAVQIQQQVLAAAPADFAEPRRQRLALYQAGKPFRSGSGDSKAPSQ